jgi:hypothetical protein
VRLLRDPPSHPVSIYQHISSNVPPDGGVLPRQADRLPDEPEPEPDGFEFRLAPGLNDEILDHGSVLSSQQRGAVSFGLLERAVRHPWDRQAFQRLNADLLTSQELGFIDPLIERVQRAGLPRAQLRKIALRLATRSNRRTPVKVGVVLLGLCASEADRDVLLTLGRHEEFTRYVGVALAKAFQDPEDSLWQLAKIVDSWGRVALVRQFAGTERSDIKAWVVRQGFLSAPFVWPSLAYPAATTGELAEQLQAEEIDDDLCLAAGWILARLIGERRARYVEDINDYEDSRRAVWLFLQHVSRRAERLEHFYPIALIHDFLTVLDGVWEPPRGWSDEERGRGSTLARWILRRPGWRPLIDDGLRSPDANRFRLADWAARKLGDDTVPVLLDRLRRRVDGEHGPWLEASRLADERQFDELLEIFLDRLRSHETGPPPVFPSWMLSILEEIERFPDKGWPLYREGLQSPNIMERRFGLSGLRAVPGDRWPPEADPMVEALALSDPDDVNRGWAVDLLNDRRAGGPAAPTEEARAERAFLRQQAMQLEWVDPLLDLRVDEGSPETPDL